MATPEEFLWRALGQAEESEGQKFDESVVSDLLRAAGEDLSIDELRKAFLKLAGNPVGD